MTTYLPQPYPDELLYSVIARYYVCSGTRSFRNLKKNLLGGSSRLNPFIPRGLSQVSQRTREVWQMSGREIAHKLTMYPYYEAFIPSPRKEQVLHDLLTGQPSAFIRFLLSRLLPNALRYCPECRKTDFEQYGETYWKRIHQMKGVAICPVHGEELIEVSFADKGARSDLIIPTETTPPEQRRLLNLNHLEKKQLLAIAHRCQSMLDNKIEPQWRDASPSLYRSIVMGKGLCSQPEGCQHKIVESFLEMYSDKVLKTLGLNERTIIWVREILFSRTRNAFQPVAHAVIQEFLSVVHGDSTEAFQFDLGPYKCPNILGQHKDLFPIKRVIFERDEKQNIFARTICCCGYGFEFYTTEPRDPSMPVVHKVTEYGPFLQKEIRRLTGSTEGSISQIALCLKVTPQEVIGILKRPTESKSAVTTLRRQWNQVVKGTPHHSINEASRRSPGLYKKVRKTDPNYLSCFPRQRYISPEGYSRIKNHRQEKDDALGERLRTAAKLIMKKLPPTRVSAAAILRESGISLWSIPKHPESQKVLKERSENSESFQMRRLKYLAERLKEKGKTPKPKQLFRDAKIRAEVHKKRLKNFVDSLCVATNIHLKA